MSQEPKIDALPAYEAPRITVMDEKAVLEVFQIQTAASSWWG
jgi:hypothetical protein